MSLARFAKRRDTNERLIIDGLCKLGAAVWQFDTPFDLLVLARGRFLTAEVKDGALPPSRRKLTPEERAYAATCEARRGPHFIWLDLEDAIRDTFG